MRNDNEGDWWDATDRHGRRDDDFPDFLPSKAEWLAALTIQYGDTRLLVTTPEPAPRCAGCARSVEKDGWLCADCERDLTPPA